MKSSFDIYEMVTNLIIERLEKGVIPWQMPWKVDNGLPQNMIHRKLYRGFNFWLLLTVADKFGSPYFLTFNQVKELGGHILKGEKGFPVVFWKILEKEEKDGSIDQVPFLRYYTVFNLKQTGGIDESKIPSSEAHDHDFDPIEQAEQVIECWTDCPEIRFDQSHAFYSPSGDYIGMPNPRTFFKDEQYYAVLYHECCHATGHINRTGRHEKLPDHRFNSKGYSQEELVAEMGASFLCYLTGIQNATIDNSAAYIKSWIRKFREDKKMLLIASSMAQKAVDYILEHQSGENSWIKTRTGNQLTEAD
ncbi:ArdC family protein [Mangrovibacterium diazotrophicum]|uniref:Antirestriction protein ArdC n=1 Tax=Mangrovibacterium diazotrophicum TaxID=1261403 RepID=A0A419W5V4_9BACT|nr:zincin-like metallopeptidase domain-containing protein [Mangrovibacterium diazotrophicum]RKD90825.1 antirestriction protein ArdC [Mangrovibacterium diazotrophicum]